METQHLEHLVIDWSVIKFYNTLMSIAAGAALATLASIFQDLIIKKNIRPKGWSISMGVAGIITFLTGFHMTLTWPLAPQYAFDNISFGEPVAVLGSLSLAISFYFWKQADFISTTKNPLREIAEDFLNFRFMLYGVGAGLIGIGLAGIVYKLFTAPPEEPIVGMSSTLGVPWMTTYLIAGAWIFIGICALYFPSFLRRCTHPTILPIKEGKWVIKLLYTLGWVLIIVGGIVYFTHIGMVIHTMK